MTRRTTPASPLATALVLASVLLPATALAKSGVVPHETGTGGGPLSTVTVPFTHGTGVTKPPGAPLQEQAGELAAKHQRGRVLSDRLQRSICDGC